MDDIFLPATSSTPEVSLKFSEQRLSIRGESYPENAAAYYGQFMPALQSWLAQLSSSEVHVDMALAYFNSSSTKMLFALFASLNDAALAGNRVLVRWFYDEEDDTILEFGEELRFDYGALDFHTLPLDQ